MRLVRDSVQLVRERRDHHGVDDDVNELVGIRTNMNADQSSAGSQARPPSVQDRRSIIAELSYM